MQDLYEDTDITSTVNVGELEAAAERKAESDRDDEIEALCELDAAKDNN